MVGADNLKTPFSVTTILRKSSKEDLHSDEDFATLEDARAAYEAACFDKDVFAYLHEVGVFEDDRGTLKIDFMTFDTNDLDWWRKCSGINRMGQRGFGRPQNHGAYATKYLAAAEQNWKL